NRFGRKLVLRKHSRFSLNFFLVFPGAFENYWEIQKMTSSMHQLDSLMNRKPLPKFEIGALLPYVLVYTDTKKNTTLYNQYIHRSTQNLKELITMYFSRFVCSSETDFI
ncbi:Uncharacterized protein FWK35_00010621, partial [Aphis craccivora]